MAGRKEEARAASGEKGEGSSAARRNGPFDAARLAASAPSVELEQAVNFGGLAWSAVGRVSRGRWVFVSSK
jgi:hypothetical protein